MLLGTFRLANVVPDLVARKIHQYASVDRYGGVDIHDLEKSNWQDILYTIASEVSTQLKSSPSVIESGDPDWRFAQSDWVGAILGPDYVDRSANPTSDFSPALPERCGGIVKSGRPLLLRNRPEGHVAGIDDEVIFSREMCSLLKREVVETGAVVTASGEELPWKRVRPTRTASILSPDSFYSPINCTLCGTEYTPTSGMWIAQSNQSVQHEFSMDKLGHSHMQARHPFVVSMEFASKAEKLLGRGYALQPVYAHGSDKAHLVRDFFSLVEQLFEGISITSK